MSTYCQLDGLFLFCFSPFSLSSPLLSKNRQHIKSPSHQPPRIPAAHFATYFLFSYRIEYTLRHSSDPFSLPTQDNHI